MEFFGQQLKIFSTVDLKIINKEQDIYSFNTYFLISVFQTLGIH